MIEINLHTVNLHLHGNERKVEQLPLSLSIQLISKIQIFVAYFFVNFNKINIEPNCNFILKDLLTSGLKSAQFNSFWSSWPVRVALPFRLCRYLLIGLLDRGVVAAYSHFCQQQPQIIKWKFLSHCKRPNFKQMALFCRKLVGVQASLQRPLMRFLTFPQEEVERFIFTPTVHLST